MASRREIRCRRCGSQLLVPPQAPAVQCRLCRTVTRFRPTAAPAEPVMNHGGAGGGRFNVRFNSNNEAATVPVPAAHANPMQQPMSPNDCNNGYGYSRPVVQPPPPASHANRIDPMSPNNSNNGYGYARPVPQPPPPASHANPMQPMSPRNNRNGYDYARPVAQPPPPASHANLMQPMSPRNNSNGYGYARPVAARPPPMEVAPPPTYGRKRALLCGVSYHGRSYHLKGSTNDVRAMRSLLVNKLGFPSDAVLTLSEDESNPLKIPTKQNIRLALKWLIQGCQPGDSLVFHYSGHGSRQKDYNGDEIDGYDEALCPTDYETEGMIIDDEVNGTIVRPLPKGAKLHAIMDTCYSGTLLDLPYLCRMNREGYYAWEDQRLPSAAYKGTSGGVALCFSACDDNETSADTTAFSNNMTGAMTYSFVQAVSKEPGLTYGSLLNSMRCTIREAKNGLRINGQMGADMEREIKTNISQEPQLSASQQFNVYKNKFTL